jgi:signal transduction histidine kinase
VTWAAAAVGWLLAAVAWLALSKRRELVSDAEHELRGPVTALALVCERMRRTPGSTVNVAMVESQLVRLRLALDDLSAAQRGRRGGARLEPQELKPLALAVAGGVESEVRAEWEAGMPRVVADPARLAQALGNLLANADEHGEGPVGLRGRRVVGAVRIEVSNRAGDRPAPGERRGRGLRIARAAAASGGGRLDYRSDGGQVMAALELPLEDSGGDGPQADAA